MSEVKTEILKEARIMMKKRITTLTKQIKALKNPKPIENNENKRDKLYEKYPYPYGFSLDCCVCVAMIGKYETIMHIKDTKLLKQKYNEFIRELDYPKFHEAFSERNKELERDYRKLDREYIHLKFGDI